MMLRLVSGSFSKLKCSGVGRDAQHDRSLCFYFNRKPTDDEMRFLHEVVERAAECTPPGAGET